jgi:saccharopine dehydrogenase-like NADP-dependent oxidoreductase
MKVVVLGAGGMGRYAAKAAAGFDFVEELVVGDLDGSAAEGLAAHLGPKARGTAVDVQNDRAMSELFEGATVVLNTVGPFFRFGPPVLRAAIAAGVHYLDINDDWESTEAMLALDEDARSAGVTAVIGVGASPGISNMLACLAMGELDEVDEVIAGFDLDAAMPEERGDKPCAATIHALHQLSGHIRVFEDGAFADAKPQRRVDFDYAGLGSRSGWTMGHPEAVTFPRTFPKLRSARVLMTMEPSGRIAARLLRVLIDAGLVSLERAGGWVERLEGVGKPVKTPADYIDEILDPTARRLPPLFAVAKGRHQGRPATVAGTVRSAPPVGMGGATGVPLAIGLSIVRPILGTKCGVFPPEAIIDPSAFFDALAPLCDPVCSSADDLTILTRSWEPTDLATALSRAAPSSAPSSSR